MSISKTGSKKRGAEDNQRQGARRKTGDIPERSSTCATSISSDSAGRGRRRLAVRVGRVTEEGALYFAQLAYILYQRGQVQVGRVQHRRLICPFEAVQNIPKKSVVERIGEWERD